MMDGNFTKWSVRSARRSMRSPGYVDLRKVRAWFADEEPPAQPPAGTPPPDDSSEGRTADKIPDWVKEDPAKAYSEIQHERKEAAKFRNAARDYEAKLNELLQAQKKAEEQKLTEQQKWEELAKQREAELNELRAKIEAQELNTLKLEVGNEFKLPKSVAMRLVGKNADEIRADAEKLAKELNLSAAASQPPPTETPAPANGTPPPAPENPQARRQQTTTVAPGGKPTPETDEERRARLYKRGAVNSPIFNPKP